jgi:hypothetical protein
MRPGSRRRDQAGTVGLPAPPARSRRSLLAMRDIIDRSFLEVAWKRARAAANGSRLPTCSGMQIFAGMEAYQG